jgi:HD-like signal output (HDOD) protein
MNTGHKNIAEQAYLAGLVHDVGKLHLLKALERLTNAGMAQAALERGLLLEIFDEMHIEQGTRLMEHWNMPLVYRSVVAKHHHAEIGENPGADETVLAILRVVNIATRKRELSLSTEQSDIPVLDLPEAVLLKITDVQLMNLYSVLDKAKTPAT